jgi:hypothetical protein
MAMLLSLRPRIIRPISMLQLHHGGRLPQRANRASDATRLLRTSPPLEKQQGATIRRPVLPSRTTGRQDSTDRTRTGEVRRGPVPPAHLQFQPRSSPLDDGFRPGRESPHRGGGRGGSSWRYLPYAAVWPLTAAERRMCSGGSRSS